MISFSATFAQVAGTWEIANQAGAIGVGPDLGSTSWWANNEADLTLRACYFDDKYVFNTEGTFNNIQDDESWIEEWQGSNPPSCAAPVAPHDGSNDATWNYDEVAKTVTLHGAGAYLGLAKVFNEGELTNPDDAPDSITYLVAFSGDGDTMTVDISFGNGYWRYIMVKESSSGIIEGTTLQAKIYPNPTSDVIYLEQSQHFKDLSIYSITGRLMFKSDQVSNSIIVENFPPGIYTLYGNDIDGKHYLTKFIIQ